MDKKFAEHLSKELFKKSKTEDFDENFDFTDLEYAIFDEGPSFTSSQGAGTPLLDWIASPEELDKAISKGKLGDHGIRRDGDDVVLITEFDPYDYVKKEYFDGWWEKVNKNKEYTVAGNKDFPLEQKLINRGGVWVLEESMPYEWLKKEIQNG